jgi:hypothetical protein
MMKIILLMISFSCGFLLMVSCSSEPDEVKSEPETKKERAPFSPIADSNITIPREIVREAPDFVYPDGPVTIYYDDGSKHSSGLYKDGKKEGSWVYFGTEPEVTIRRETYEGGVKVSEESFE